MPISPQQKLARQIGAHESWARTEDRGARTAPARKAALERFERQVDPDGTMDPAERARRAEHAKKAYFLRLALKSAQARARRKTGGGRCGPDYPPGGCTPERRCPRHRADVDPQPIGEILTEDE